jgi:hypothetical protein
VLLCFYERHFDEQSFNVKGNFWKSFLHVKGGYMWQFGLEKGMEFVEFAKKIGNFLSIGDFCPQKNSSSKFTMFFFHVLDGKHLINDKTI